MGRAPVSPSARSSSCICCTLDLHARVRVKGPKIERKKSEPERKNERSLRTTLSLVIIKPDHVLSFNDTESQAPSPTYQTRSGGEALGACVCDKLATWARLYEFPWGLGWHPAHRFYHSHDTGKLPQRDSMRSVGPPSWARVPLREEPHSSKMQAALRQRRPGALLSTVNGTSTV